MTAKPTDVQECQDSSRLCSCSYPTNILRGYDTYCANFSGYPDEYKNMLMNITTYLNFYGANMMSH